LEQQTDQKLIAQTLAGDNLAFNLLVTRYQKAVYAAAARILRDHDLADEAAQETFVKAYFALKQYDDSYKFYTWILRICLNLCYDQLKKKKRQAPLDEAFEHQGPDPAEIFAGDDACQRIRKEIDRLPVDQRMVVQLRVDRDLSYSEIGQTLKIPIGTVMSRLSRARQTLGKSLKGIL
jgi:RNA polymerase sigma-70 factor (ECF subfamily)